MNIQVRRAESRDYNDIERIMKQAHQIHVSLRPDIYRSADPVLSPQDYELRLDSGVWWAAECDGTIRGFMEIYRRHYSSHAQMPRDTLFIATIAVDEPYRSQGIGHALLQKAKELRDAAGMASIELQVNALNTAAMHMYESFGFVPESINMELRKEEE